ncbi:MAG: DMT family transporter [Planctomycetes bacterium]|nr:DMT family transporter [Planctomycetota bacterium]
MRGSSTLPYVWMLAACFVFTIMGAMAHAAGQMCDWQTVAMSRCLLVFLFVGATSLISGKRLVFWRPRILWMRSLAGSVSLVASFYALTRLNVSTVLTLTNTFPLWVAILSWPMLGVWPAGRVWVAMLAGIAGVWMIQQPQDDGSQLALFIALMASLATAIAMLGLHRLKGVNSSAIVVHFAMVATVFCVISFMIFPFTPGKVPFWHWQPMLLLIGIGVSASIGQLCLTKAFACGDPARVSIVGLSQVVFAVPEMRCKTSEIDCKMIEMRCKTSETDCKVAGMRCKNAEFVAAGCA